MKTLPYVLAFALAAAGCRDSSKLTRDQKQYEVVEEGSSGGAPSASLTDGAQPPAALTNTNADTTSSFSLDPNIASGATATQPGTIAGTLPPMTSATTEWSSGRIPAAPRTRPATPARAETPPPIQNEPVVVQQQTEPAPAETTPAESTTATDSGPAAAPAPAEPQEEKKEEKKEEAAPAETPAPTSTAPPG